MEADQTKIETNKKIQKEKEKEIMKQTETEGETESERERNRNREKQAGAELCQAQQKLELVEFWFRIEN